MKLERQHLNSVMQPPPAARRPPEHRHLLLCVPAGLGEGDEQAVSGAWAGGWPGERHLCGTLTSCGNSLVKTFVFCFLVMKIFLKRWMKPFCFEALKA